MKRLQNGYSLNNSTSIPVVLKNVAPIFFPSGSTGPGRVNMLSGPPEATYF